MCCTKTAHRQNSVSTQIATHANAIGQPCETRSDVSRNLRGVAKCRESVSKCRENVVLGRFCVVVGRFCVASGRFSVGTCAGSRIESIRHNPLFGSMIRQNRPKPIGDLRSKQGHFGSQKPKKHPKKRFLSLRNCDLRRFWRVETAIVPESVVKRCPFFAYDSSAGKENPK